MKRTMQSVLFATAYTLAALLICIAVGASFKACQSEPDYIQSSRQEEPIALEVVAYNPCKDSLLYLERGIEGKQRQQQCGVK